MHETEAYCISFLLLFFRPRVFVRLLGILLKRILMGPKYGHWNLAEGGSHIRFYREPDIYERGIHYCMNYFHA